MSSPPTDRILRAARWLWPAALLAVAPKCILCLVAYVGLGTALGLGGPELCGAPNDSGSAGVVGRWFIVGLAAGAIGVFWRIRRRCGPNCIGQPISRLFRPRLNSAWPRARKFL
jgi:hypothetical protein